MTTTTTDELDGLDYAAGSLTLEDLNTRAEERYSGEVKLRGSVDPVAIYDAMREAGTSLMGSYIWLADHAATPEETERWRQASSLIYREREQVDARDVDAQRAATVAYIARERALRPLVRV